MSIKSTITRVAGRSVLKVQKYSPEILTAVGVVGTVTAAVLAARATLKLEDTVTTIQYNIATAKELAEDPNEPSTQKDVVHAYTNGVIDLAKLYGPAVTLEVFSVASILCGYGIMKRRNVALIAAYKGIEQAFASYRERVIAEHGEEADRDYAHGIQTTTQIDEKTGKKVKVTTVDPNQYSMYAKFFDEGNRNFQQTNDLNLMFLRSQQNYHNDLLIARGHVFLNEVYDALGFERTKAGAVTGWVLTNDNQGDNFVDFGIYSLENSQAHKFVNGEERAILLDFNVNGPILDLI